MQAFRQIRIKDIADRCHISAGTVDRVLHNRGEVSAETRRNIMKAVEELEYRPNILASTLASRKLTIFATLLPTSLSEDGYWSKPVTGVNKRASELQHYGVHFELFFFDQFTPADFEEKAAQILALNPDGVVLAPFFIRESLKFISRLRDKKIPFVFIDSEINDQGQLAYVGQNSFQCGLLSGKLMFMMASPGEPLLVFHFGKEMDNQNHLIQREQGFYEWFRKHDPGRRIRTFETGIPESLVLEPRFSGLLIQNKAAGVFVTNSQVHLAAFAIEKLGLKGIRLIGHDLLRENVKYLRKGIVDYLICQRPEEQGYSAVDKLFQAIVRRSPVQQHYYTPIDIIVKENIDFYEQFK